MIVITGGTGFIGSNLAAALAERGERIAVCDHLGETGLGMAGLGDDGLGADGKWRNIAKLEIEDVVPPDQLLAFLSGAADRLPGRCCLASIPAGSTPGGQSSKAMMMSAPRLFCTSIARSGVRRTMAPSTMERKVTPSSSMAFRSAIENAW